MRQSNSLARTVLHARPAKQVENPLVILFLNPATIICYFVDIVAGFGAASDSDFAGNTGPEVFQRVVDQIGEYLFERKAITDDTRQPLDFDRRVGFLSLMRNRLDDGLDQLAHVDALGLEF